MKVTILKKGTTEVLGETWVPATANISEAIRNILENLGLKAWEVDVKKGK